MSITNLKSQSGFTLTEMVVTTGLLGGLVAVTMNVVSQQKSNETYVESKGEIQKAVSLVAMNLKDPDNCRNVLAGKTFSATPSTETKISQAIAVKLKKKQFIADCTATPESQAIGGLSVDPKTCIISGTPSASNGPVSYILKVKYADGQELTSKFVVDIKPSQTTGLSNKISFDGAQGAIGVKGKYMQLTPSTFVPPTDVEYKCSVNSPLPSGLTLNQKTCAIEGIPSGATNLQNYEVTLTKYPKVTTDQTGVKTITSVGESYRAIVPVKIDDPTTQTPTYDAKTSGFYMGSAGTFLRFIPPIPRPSSTTSNQTTQTATDTAELIKPNANYKHFKTESIDVLEDTKANNVVNLQLNFRLKNRDAKRWNVFNSNSDSDTVIVEKIPLIITKDSSGKITDCSALAGESSATAKEKFCNSLGGAATWDSTAKKCKFNSKAQCPVGQVMTQLNGLEAKCVPLKDNMNLTDFFDESPCTSSGQYRVVESNGKLKVDCMKSVLITQKIPDQGGTLPVGTPIKFKVDTALDQTTVQGNIKLIDITLNPTTGPNVAATVTYDNTSKEITISPSASLSPGGKYKIQITEGVKTSAPDYKTINGITNGKLEEWSFVAQ